MAQAHEYDAIVLDVMLPGIERLRDVPAAARGGDLVAGADADRARLGRGPRRRARHRRRRLPRQAVRVRRAARPPARARPARRRGAAERARGRRPAPRPRDAARSRRGGQRDPLSAKEFALLETSCAGPAQVLSRVRPARARLGLRLREPLERRRRLRPPPARRRSTSRSAGARSRRSAARATGCAPTTGDERTTDQAARRRGAFAVAMAVVLAATGWFLYARLESHLALALDRELQAARAGPGSARPASRAPRSTCGQRRPPHRDAARATPSSSIPRPRARGDATARAPHRSCTPAELRGTPGATDLREPVVACRASTSPRGSSRRRSRARRPQARARRRRDARERLGDARAASATSS